MALSFRTLARLAASLALVVCLGAGQGFAEDEPPTVDVAPGARVPVRIVAGKLVVTCDVSTRVRRLPVNLLVELENPCGLQLHNQAAGAMRTEARDGSTIPITVHLPDLDIRVERREHGPEKAYEDFTKYHGEDLGEVAVVGTIGHGILSKYHLVFDLKDGVLEISPPRARDPETPEEESGVSVVDVSVGNGLIWCPVSLADGKPAALALGTAQFDSLIDERIARRMKHPAGDVGAVRVGEFDASQYIAWRPEPVVQVHPDGAFGVAGINFLQHFRVEIDRVNRRVTLEETQSPDFPVADLAYFKARVEEAGDPVEAFLEAHPEARLAPEAAQLLIDLRLDEEADAASFGKAVGWVDKTAVKDLRATTILDLMERISEEGHDEGVLAAGKVGIESGREDRYPDAVHKIHARMGRILLKKDADKEAWRHLLSAAFGMPEDGLVNLDLGRFYERSGRLRRAFSRYVQAVIQPESGTEAIAGLKRLQPKMGEEERFSVDLVEKLIGGKVESFGAATKYTGENKGGRVVLCEFFTNAHLKPAIGGALGNEGLISHFDPKHVAFLAYHLPSPRADPMVNELSVAAAQGRQIPGPYVHRIDGTMQGPGAGRIRQKERIYNILKNAVTARLKVPAFYKLKIDAKTEDGVVKGTLTVEGEAEFGLEVHLVLAERGVLFPGESKVVIHRMVARKAILNPTRGVMYEPTDGKMEIPFEVSLADIAKENTLFLKRLTRGGVDPVSMDIDPAQVSLVAYIREWTGGVFQATRFDPPVAGEDEE